MVVTQAQTQGRGHPVPAVKWKLTAYVPMELRERLRNEAHRLRVSQTSLVVAALRRFLEE